MKLNLSWILCAVVICGCGGGQPGVDERDVAPADSGSPTVDTNTAANGGEPDVGFESRAEDDVSTAADTVMTVDELMRLCLEQPYKILETRDGQPITVTGVIRDIWPNKYTYYSSGPRFEFHHEFTLETADFGPGGSEPLLIECDSAFRPTEAEARQTLAGIQVGQTVTVSGDLSFRMGPSYTVKIRGASIIDSEAAPDNAPPAEELMTLERLEPLLDGYGEREEAGEEAVKECNRSFTEVLTEEGTFPPELLEAMRQLPEIEELRISEPISASGLRQLATLPSVRSLEITRLPEDVTGADLKVLSRLPGMDSFYLARADAPVDGSLAEAAAGFSLRHLGLTRRETGLPLPTQEAVEHIGGMSHLESLDLTVTSDDHIVPLAGMQNLRLLALRVNDINGDGLIHLSGLTNLLQLRFISDTDSPDAAAPLGTLTSLRSLHLFDGEYGDLAILTGLTRLQVLDMRSVGIGPGSGASLARLGQLQSLKVLSAGMTDDELAAFSESSKPYLKVLDLSDCRSITDAGLSALARQSWPQLFELYLNNSQVGDAGLEALAAIDAPHLERIFLNGTQITDAGVAHFKSWEDKPYLHVNDTDVTQEGLDAVYGR